MRLLIALLVLFGGAWLFAAPASAHASVVTTSPSDGARLQAAPARVSITFDEPVGLGSLGYLHVVDDGGTRVEAGPAAHPGGNARVVAVRLEPGLRDGTYTESYRVVSADSHPVSGVIRFAVGNGPLTPAPMATHGSDTGVAAAFDVVRWLSYAGFALLGGGWLLLTIWPTGRHEHRAVRLVWAGGVGAAVGALLELLLDGPYASGRPLSSMVDGSLIDATLHTGYGQAHCARLVLLGVVAFVLARGLQPASRPTPFDHVFWPAAVGVAVTFASVGHPVSTPPLWASVALDTVHVTAMAAWVGGLAILAIALLPRRDPGELVAVLPVFSRVAFGSVVLLAVTGTYAAWRGVGSWRALFQTEYGLLVAAKVTCFGGLLVLGNIARQAIQRRARRVARPVPAFALTGGPGADAVTSPEPVPTTFDAVTVERMRRSVLLEVVLAAVVLAFTSVLVSQPRGAEALAARDRAPVSGVAPLGGGRVATVTIDPGTHGRVSLDLSLPAGRRVQAVSATATEPDAQLGPIPIRLSHDAAGLYSASGLSLPVAGRWQIGLVVTYSQFDAVTTQATVTLR